jgi:hypothetical protein
MPGGSEALTGLPAGYAIEIQVQTYRDGARRRTVDEDEGAQGDPGENRVLHTEFG